MHLTTRLFNSICCWGCVRHRITSNNDKSVQYDYLTKWVYIDKLNNVKRYFTTFRNELSKYTNDHRDLSSNISVYYEYLPTGLAININ